MSRRRRVVIAALVAAVAAFAALATLSSARQHDERRLEVEGRAGVRALCDAVSDAHRDRGVWVHLGPTPPDLPKDAFDFPMDSGFTSIGFAPPRGHFQYAVSETDAGARCVAKALGLDLKPIEFELNVGADADAGEVRTSGATR